MTWMIVIGCVAAYVAGAGVTYAFAERSSFWEGGGEMVAAMFWGVTVPAWLLVATMSWLATGPYRLTERLLEKRASLPAAKVIRR